MIKLPDEKYQALRDNTYKGGFHLFNGYSVVKGAVNSNEIISFNENAPCEWVLHELNSKYFLHKTDKKIIGNMIEYSNGLKKVARKINENGETELYWGIYTKNDYSEPRKSPEIPWVHMMTEQKFVKPLIIKEYKRFIFNLDVKLDGFVNHLSEKDYLPGIQAAQTNMYHIVRNYNKDSKDFGKFMWFGVNIYDNRHPVHAGTNIFDTGFAGATDTIIYVTDGKTAYHGETPHDGKWHTIRIDTTKELNTCLIEAKKMNLMLDTKLDDLGIENFYLSSEISGTFDLELRFKNLGFYAEKYII